MTYNRPLTIGIAVVAVIAAIIVIIALITSPVTPPQNSSVSSVQTNTPLQDENTVRTQVYAEMTATNQAQLVVSLQETIDAQGSVQSTPIGQTPVPVQPTAITQSNTPESAQGQSNTGENLCPASPLEMATLIGGNSEYWSPPTFPGGAWVYRNKDTFVTLHYPGYGRMDVWIDGAVSIENYNQQLLSERQFDEASFHCAKRIGVDCPTTPSGAADLVGGAARNWQATANGNGQVWQYGAGAPPITITAPNFGRIEYRNPQAGTLRNGQQVNNVTEATLHCND